MNVTVRRILLIVIILGVSIAIAMRMKSMKQPPKTNPGLKVPNRTTAIIYQPETLDMNIPVAGRVVAADKIDVVSEVTGKLISGSHTFKEGIRFRKGEALMRLDDSEAKMNVRALRSNLESSLTVLLADIKIDYPKEFDTWSKYVSDLDPSKMLESLPQVNSTGLKNLLAAKGINQQFYQIKAAEEQLKKFVLYAPFTGVITAANVTEGALIRAGQTIGTFVNTDRYELEIGLGVNELEKINLGDQLVLNAEQSSDKWIGKVARISDVIDPSTQTFKVYITVSGDDLYDGIYLSGVLKAGKAEDVMKYPMNLVTSDDQVYMIIDGEVHKSPVEIVHREGSDVLIRGLKEGTTLIGGQVPGIYEGMQISTIE